MFQKRYAYGLLFLAAIFFTLNLASAQQDFTYVISNSEDWRDVYSVLMYGSIISKPTDFLVSERHSVSILGGISKENKMQIISSKTKPFVLGYSSIIQGQGFASANEVSYDNINLELAKLVDTKNFVVIGDSYGYNAVAIAPYAIMKKAWVLFANRRNIAEIDNFLSTRQKDELLVYGYVDREVKNTLQKYNPISINNGDRFTDNIDIVKRYISFKPTKQVTLTNGEFIEKEIMSSTSPVLFTGESNVPDQIRDYLLSSDIEVGVLVGNDLIGAATNIRRTAGISVMVKFARSARNPGGTISQVEGLDIFYLPAPKLDLKLTSAKYNKATSKLEITYKSDSNIPLYLKGTITLSSGDIQTKVGELDVIFVAPGDYRTIVYSDVNMTGDKLNASIFTIFGESKRSLDRILQQVVEVQIVDVIDKCEIQVNKITYRTYQQAFIVDVDNIGSTDCYVDIELQDVLVDKSPAILGTEGSVQVPAKKSKNIVIPAELTEEDLKDNPFVTVIAYYGERADSLINIFKGKFELNISRFNVVYYSIAAIAIILILIIFFLFWRRRKKKKDDDF